MERHKIKNPVPTPEEMAEILGVSPEFLEKIRAIVNSPVKASRKTRARAAKKAAARQQAA